MLKTAPHTLPDPATVPVAEIPALLGHLEAFKATLWSRLATLPARPAPLEPRVQTLLTIPEVATQLGVAKSFLYELHRQGRLPTITVGQRYVRIRPDDLEQWLTERSNKTLDGPALTGGIITDGKAWRESTRVRAVEKAVGREPGKARRSDGRHRGHRLAVGGREAAHPGDGSAVADTAGPN